MCEVTEAWTLTTIAHQQKCRVQKGKVGSSQKTASLGTAVGTLLALTAAFHEPYHPATNIQQISASIQPLLQHKITEPNSDENLRSSSLSEAS